MEQNLKLITMRDVEAERIMWLCVSSPLSAETNGFERVNHIKKIKSIKKLILRG
jgi:hypothetical protein